MLLLYRWQRFFFALLVLILGGIVLPSLIPSQAKAEPDQPGQTNVEMTGKELAQLVYDRENGDDSTVHTIIYLPVKILGIGNYEAWKLGG